MSNPDRYNYNENHFTYDPDTDVITDDRTGEQYTGDGDKIEGYED